MDDKEYTKYVKALDANQQLIKLLVLEKVRRIQAEAELHMIKEELLSHARIVDLVRAITVRIDRYFAARKKEEDDTA